jgi:hypothetical protein
MTPRQKQQSDFLFNLAANLIRANAGRRPRKKVESKAIPKEKDK